MVTIALKHSLQTAATACTAAARNACLHIYLHQMYTNAMQMVRYVLSTDV